MIDEIYNVIVEDKLYRMWWKDQSTQDVFSATKINEMARKYSFDAEELLLQDEVTFLDDNGDIVGGVTTDKYYRVEQ